MSPDILDEASRQTELLAHVRRSDRQATLERLVAYLAHGLGTPLNVVEGRAAMIAGGEVVGADVAKSATIILAQTARMTRFLHGVVTSARKHPSNGATVEATTDLEAIAGAAVAMFVPVARARGSSISFEGDGSRAPVRGNPEELLLALTHVLDNGVRMTPDGANLTVRVRSELRADDTDNPDVGASVPFFCVEVDDEGAGIDVDVLARLFAPFTTSCDDREGIGLGLFIAQSIAKEHGGWLDGANKAGKGALFSLHLPRGESRAE